MCAAAADAVGCDPRDILVCSTGLIGFRLPMRKILTAIPRLGETLSREGHRDAAKGILTTDTRPKEAQAVRDDYSVGGMAKGCGMLAPNMATMLAFLTTDAELTPEELLAQLARLAADRGLIGVEAITPEVAPEPLQPRTRTACSVTALATP